MNIRGDDKSFCVYMHINNKNGKKYIGITSKKDPQKRWGRNGSGYKCQFFYKAIQKYGWDNFSHEIIATDLSIEEALNLETELITKFRSLWTDNGYNIISEQSDNMTHACVPIYQFDLYGNYLDSFDSITAAANKYNIHAENIVVALNDITKMCGGFIWRYQKDVDDIESIKNIINRNNFDRYYPIYQFDLSGKYINSFSNAKEANNTNSHWFSCSILDCCRGKYKQVAGYVWRFQIDVPDLDEFQNNFELPEVKKQSRARKVCQFDLKGNHLNDYKNATEASVAVGCCVQMISFACCGKAQTAKGYIWRYEQDCPDRIIDAQKILSTPPRNGWKRSGIPTKKTVYQFDLSYNLIKIYDSTAEAGRQSNIDRSQISCACRGEQLSAGGFIWSYVDLREHPELQKYHSKEKAINQYDLDGNYLETFKSLAAAGRHLGKNYNSIWHCLNGLNKTAFGYIWKYVDK